jgi:tRNA A-37 threonylcarbamoyl transferase component Bud32
MSSLVSTGSVVAGFRVESLIGKGAMGEVYLAETIDGGGRVALKVLEPQLADAERFRQRFLRESQLAASLDHPHIVPLLASGEYDGVLYIAMAYIPGSDLRELLRQDGPLEPERAILLVAQAADALDAAHAAGLVHRDVKPGNILVTEQDDVYVCDFGLARHVTSASSLTGDRGFVGTIDYVPPEQVRGEEIGARADVYALGCVLFECLTGARPYERESELAVVYAHLNEPPPFLSDLRPDLPAAFDDVFQTALAKSPEGRFASCGELAAVAEGALHSKRKRRRRIRFRRLLVATAGLLVALSLALGALLALRGAGAVPTISQTALGGATLGMLHGTNPGDWGRPGAIIVLGEPDQYAKQTYAERKVAVYYDSAITDAIQAGRVGAVEITTWNPADRTAAGAGPCLTVEHLKAAYGDSLKPSSPSVVDGQTYGYTVGDHLFFAMGPPPKPTHVTAVALYRNPVNFAGFNAINDGPCI